MEKESSKVLVLGVDGMDPRLTKELVDKGVLPNIKKYIEIGSCREDLVMLGGHPTVTPSMWTTLGTGAYSMTHGITEFYLQSPDKQEYMLYGLDSRDCKAEQVWNLSLIHISTQPDNPLTAPSMALSSASAAVSSR